MLRQHIKPRTIHKDRYGHSDSLDSLIRVNGRDLLDQATADQSDLLREYEREEAEREASIERQAVLTMVRAQVAYENEQAAQAASEIDEQAAWAVELAEEEEAAVGRIYALKGYAGLVEQRRSRRLGVLVSLYHADQAGIGADSKWVTVCEDHGAILEHDAMPSGRSIMAHPDEWCEDCREAVA